MGEWHKHQPPSPAHPCTNCQAGYCSRSTEIRNGELWIKSDDCHETCRLLKDYFAGVRLDTPIDYEVDDGYKERLRCPNT